MSGDNANRGAGAAAAKAGVPETLNRFQWWVTAIDARHSGVSSAVSWAKLIEMRVPRGRYEEVAKAAALEWWDETDQCTTCEVALRVHDDTRRVHYVTVLIEPTVRASVVKSEASVFNAKGGEA